MKAQKPTRFKFTSLAVCPGTFVGKPGFGHFTPSVVGVTLVDEKRGFTGVYLRDSNGGLWPARTVSHKPAEHHKSVCDAWLARDGVHEDKRKVLTSR